VSGIRSLFIAILIASALAVRADAEIRYTITDLGVLSGAPSNGASYVTAMNNLSQVCGYGDTTVSTSSGPALANHAWLYTGSGALLDLGTLGPAKGLSIAKSINDSGTVVGYADSSASTTLAFRYTQGGGMQPLPTLGGAITEALSINNLGQIAGVGRISDGTSHGFLYYPSTGQMVDLGVYKALLVNDSSLVVSVTGSYPNLRTFTATGGTSGWVDIGSLGGTETNPYGINSRGDIVGEALDASGTNQQAFLFSGGTLTKLPSFGGTMNTAYGINNYGEIVGGSTYPGNSTGGGFVYFGGNTIQDLNSLVDPSLNWMIGNAFAVNNSGQIAAEGVQPGKPEHALLLTPVPEPPSILIPFCAAFAAAFSIYGARLSGRIYKPFRSGKLFHLFGLGESDYDQALVHACFRGRLCACRNFSRKEIAVREARRKEVL
jgi:probable HAF family extracellular repeat protein